MSKPLRSATSTQGRNMAGARALWRATGMTDGDFGKPIIAIANSYTQFVPGHVHLKDMGDLVAGAIREAGGVAKEFNTIAVDDGIAMGHDGMLYSLPSREVIADSVEYMVNAHRADALVCISNCDKITPGMLIAAMRLNIRRSSSRVVLWNPALPLKALLSTALTSSMPWSWLSMTRCPMLSWHASKRMPARPVDLALVCSPQIP